METQARFWIFRLALSAVAAIAVFLPAPSWAAAAPGAADAALRSDADDPPEADDAEADDPAGGDAEADDPVADDAEGALEPEVELWLDGNEVEGDEVEVEGDLEPVSSTVTVIVDGEVVAEKKFVAGPDETSEALEQRAMLETVEALTADVRECLQDILEWILGGIPAEDETILTEENTGA